MSDTLDRLNRILEGERTPDLPAFLVTVRDEIEQLKEALAVSRHETGTVDNALYKYEVLWSACKGWREFDWPEGFSRRTADLIVENAERVLASTGRKEPELTKDTELPSYKDVRGILRCKDCPGTQSLMCCQHRNESDKDAGQVGHYCEACDTVHLRCDYCPDESEQDNG